MKQNVLFEAYQSWLKQWAVEGRSLWFGTLMFNHLGSNKKVTVAVMQREMQRVYVTLLSNIVRNPRNKPGLKLPILIGAPDSPVFKHKPQTRFADLAQNEGVHYHFILAMPLVSRLQMPLDLHIKDYQHIYVGNQGNVRVVDVRPITDLRKKIADYMFKHMKRSTYSLDDILILPATATKKGLTSMDASLTHNVLIQQRSRRTPTSML
ncbi:hypothetical protein [Rhodopila sp.]|uniref:hypothetical protein n=1 Tax=Rhodopila sp. TaxID=2480087 RepID=UPI003D14347D